MRQQRASVLKCPQLAAICEGWLPGIRCTAFTHAHRLDGWGPIECTYGSLPSI